MKFGYFTLSDNRYPDNPRSSAQFMCEIRDQAILAEELGMHSAWIGEHHFNRRGCIPVPGMVLSYVAAATERIRLGPAVIVLPMHHPINVAEEWAALDHLSGGRVDFAAGRGYDAQEFVPFGANFQDSAALFTEGMDLLQMCWEEDGPITFKGRYYDLTEVEIHPRPLQKPFRPYMGSFSKFSMELAARYDWNLMLAPFAAAFNFGSLGQAIDVYREICAAEGATPRKITCSYFVHLGETEAEMEFGRDRLLDYISISGLRPKGTHEDGAQFPPTMKYFQDWREHLADTKRKGKVGLETMLFGPNERIIERLKEVEADGIDEVILYFNFGLKPDAMVRDEMQRFMSEIAPAFEGGSG